MAVPADIGSLANDLYHVLIDGEDIVFPNIDFSDLEIPTEGEDSPFNRPVQSLTTCDLTSGSMDGNGTFDVLMRSIKEHLHHEHKAQRLSGTDYAQALISLTTAAMGNATQFLVSRDTAYWSSVLARYQAIGARMNAFTARTELLRVMYSVLTEKSTFALQKVQAQNLATEAKTKEFAYEVTLPVEADILDLQKRANEITNLGLEIQNDTADFNLEGILYKQSALIEEQIEVQRAQTSDERTDGTTVTGSVGVQKDLYRQQIDSYQRDAELKAARLFSDAWITQKTIDEGLTAPNAFTNPTVDAVLARIRSNNDL